MFRPGTVNEADYSPQEQPVSEVLPFGNIQKIAQEGSKNTYVLILSKDCIKGESSKGPPVIKCPPVGNHGRAVQRRPASVQDNDFDSPTLGSIEGQSSAPHPTEDVKLNLSNINDDEYDSNTSATNVFLKPDLLESENAHDSAIEADFSESSFQHSDSLSSHSRSYFCEKSKMNTYVIPSPLTVQQERKASIGQHKFPMISPQIVGGKQSMLYNTPNHGEKQSSNSTARKIFLVTPEQGIGGGLKKSVAYTNEAVPTMGKSKVNDFSGSVSLLKKTNPKAVPTFNNISPINQTQVPSNSFVPINPSASPAFGVQGPFTSTPVMSDTNPRLQQLKHESSTHRPVYVIPSPFSRQNSVETPCNLLNAQNNDSETSVIVAASTSVPTLNNSSGFISGSSSLELFEASSSLDSPRLLADTDRVYSPMEISDFNKKGVLSRETLERLSQNYGEKKSVKSETYELPDGSGGVVVTVEEDVDCGISVESETEPSVTSSQESEASDIVERGVLNKSLTNIQWLKGMQLKEEKASPTFSHHPHQNQMVQWKSLSYDEVRQISEECGRDKRPPFSYMSMIQMALMSREDRKMMLKEICKWIEDMFPYYKHTAKQGWRNSIRHNLSLYNIFERSPAKRHGSYWTIKHDMEPKLKQYKDRSWDSRCSTPSLPSQTPGAMIPIIPMYSSMGQLSAITPGSVYMQPPTSIAGMASKKKGPPPILPRPSPYTTPQAYALIPINSMGHQQFGGSAVPQQQPMIVNYGGGQVSACPSPGISEMSAAVASIQVSSASPIPIEQGHPTALIKEHKYNKVPAMNIVKQAWIDSQSFDTASSVDSDIVPIESLTSSNEMASSSEFTKNRGKSKRPRIINSGLPKPTMYVDKEEREVKLTGSKRRKLQQKERPLFNDSSDEEEDEGEKFISNLVKDLTVPRKSADHPIEDGLTTSTPMKKVDNTAMTQLPSPIAGLTPLRNTGLFDGSFLDSLADRKALGLSPSPTGSKKVLQNLTESPNSSLLDFVTIPTLTSPDKFGEGSPDVNNPNLSKFLAECGLDPTFVENTENFPNLNWSSIQQIVDSMDTTE